TDEAETIGIRKSREALADADLVLVVLEAGIPLRDDEAALITSLTGRRALIARNKSDLDSNGAVETEKPLTLPTIFTSALTGQGVTDLRSSLLDMVQNRASESEGGMLTNLRHHEAVTAAIASLHAAKSAAAARIPHEMVLLDLYASLRQLDSLTGETTADDIL